MPSPLELARIHLQHWAMVRLQALRPPDKPAHLAIGDRGELEALFFLRRQGYLIVERRWRTKEFNGDLDLVGWDGDTLCFVEVKSRTRRDLTPAASAVDYAKKQMLRRMAKAYLRTLPAAERYNTAVRMDVVSIYGPPYECELIRNAFALSETSFQNRGV